LSHKVKIVTDSSAYLLPETITRYDIRVVPLKITFGTRAYSEEVDVMTSGSHINFNLKGGTIIAGKKFKRECQEWN